jgi:hypothetical protein
MIILTHVLYLRMEEREARVEIAVHKPTFTELDWSCRYEIDWPSGRVVRDVFGDSAVQALVLALQFVGTDLYTSDFHRDGRLRAYAGPSDGYGFPVPPNLRDMLVGVDAHAAGVTALDDMWIPPDQRK